MRNSRQRRESLVYHAKPQPGKIKIVPTKPYQTQRDLAIAYSPGVAEPCLEIAETPTDVYKYTAKGNLVAVISNGTAVLGLGDIGPLASKPVMEGKCVLFKIFADIDGIDIEIDTKDVDAFVETVKRIAPTFGGINLEDIKAPEAFEIERRLKEELDIPVMHDDQHGTAIISAAALLNAVELAGKSMNEVKIVVSGAGAAAVSCTKLYKAFGALAENIVMLDSKGVIRCDRDSLDKSKLEFATDRDLYTLEDAMVNADVFIGLSIADIVTPDMLLSMAPNPIVFAMANPDPEIKYDVAVRTREDLIMATGRSDHPNQVNNVLGFPFIFRGALDVRATKINEAMKMAAVKALADLAKEPVPEQVNITYDITRLTFGREYIIPKPFDPRLISKIPIAVAKAAMESGVAQIEISDWDKYEEELMARSGNDNKFIRSLHEKAKEKPMRVVFAEADQIDVLKAAQFVSDEGIAEPILLGDREVIESLMEELEFETSLTIIDPSDDAEQARRDQFAKLLWKRGERDGVQRYSAGVRMMHRNYFGPMMVLSGEADAMISGYSRSFPKVLLPVLETVGRGQGVKRASTMNIMMTPRGPLFLADTAININPTAEELAEIAVMTAREVKAFGFEPVMAMLSYSNYGSSSKPEARKVKQAVKLLHQNHPELIVDGEIQADFALNPEMGAQTFPFSKLANRKVNTLIFPNLDSANITYKLMKELHGVKSIGPVMLGLDKPIHILQLGASVEEIINMTSIAVIDAQRAAKK
ncbi:MAG: NADP-dependent malic enzyme [Bacteroidetes bacterium]|nr:NADP-dependent malic enzyme [Bacteroidota bacterium]